jgi:sigma-B regulation protein RsbU (phosphoserine phosphatase)
VSGKGMAAALIMATFRAALRAELRRASTVEDVMDAVDALLLESIDPSRYVTAVYGVLDPATGEFNYVNCGQTPPLLIRADSGCTLLDKGRPALGMPVCVPGESGIVTIEPGDMLAIYTDGVVELSNGCDEEYGRHRLESLLRDRADQPAEVVVQDVQRATMDFRGLPAYDDDFTLMVVRRHRV